MPAESVRAEAYRAILVPQKIAGNGRVWGLGMCANAPRGEGAGGTMQGALDNGWSRSQRNGQLGDMSRKLIFLYWAYGLRNIFLREHRLSNRVYRVHQSACVAQPPRAGNQLVCGRADCGPGQIDFAGAGRAGSSGTQQHVGQ